MRRPALFALLFGGAVLAVLSGCAGGNPNLSQAEDAMETKNYDRALANVDSALAADSANVEAYKMRARILRAKADSTMSPKEYEDLYVRAREAEDKAIKYNPGARSDVEGRRTLIFTQQYQRGASAFQKAQQRSDTSAFRRAASFFGAAAATMPDSADATLNQAYASLNLQRLKENGNMAKTIPVLEKYLEKEETPTKNAYEILSALYMKEGETEKAIELLEEARSDLSARKTHFKITGSRGLTYSGSVKVDGSTKSVDGPVPDKISVEGTGMVSGTFEKKQKKGQLRVQLVYKGTAVEDTTVKSGTASISADLNEKAPLAQLEGRLLNAYNKSGNTEKAMAEYRKQIEENPENVTYRYNYGSMLLNAQRYEEAVEQLKKAIEMDPSRAEAQYNLGAAYTNMARKVQDKIRAIDDSLETVREGAMEGNRQPTQEERKKVNALDKKRTELVQNQRELFKNAIPPLERARQLADQNSSIRTDACRVLVTAYVQTERTDKARELQGCANMEGQLQQKGEGN